MEKVDVDVCDVRCSNAGSQGNQQFGMHFIIRIRVDH